MNNSKFRYRCKTCRYRVYVDIECTIFGFGCRFIVKVRVNRQKRGCAAHMKNLYQNQFYSASVPNFVPVHNFQCAYVTKGIGASPFIAVRVSGERNKTSLSPVQGL